MEAITSLCFCYGRPEYRFLFNRITLDLGGYRAGIHKHELLRDLAPSENGISLIIFPTRMPLLLGYLQDSVAKVEVEVEKVPDDFCLKLMASRGQLKTPWERPVSCYYPVLRELGMCYGNIVGMALRVPLRKALQVTHIRLTPFRSVVPVDINMSWLRPHQHDFPMPFDPTQFIIIPPMSRCALPPHFRRCDRFSVAYKYKDSAAAEPDCWYEMSDGYAGYFLHPETFFFEDGETLRVYY